MRAGRERKNLTWGWGEGARRGARRAAAKGETHQGYPLPRDTKGCPRVRKSSVQSRYAGGGLSSPATRLCFCRSVSSHPFSAPANIRRRVRLKRKVKPKLPEHQQAEALPPHLLAPKHVPTHCFLARYSATQHQYAGLSGFWGFFG